MSYNLEMLAPYKGCQFEVQYPTKKVVYTNPAQINFDTAQRIVVVRPDTQGDYAMKLTAGHILALRQCAGGITLSASQVRRPMDDMRRVGYVTSSFLGFEATGYSGRSTFGQGVGRYTLTRAGWSVYARLRGGELSKRRAKVPIRTNGASRVLQAVMVACALAAHRAKPLGEVE